MEVLGKLRGLPAASLPGDQEESAVAHSLDQLGFVFIDRQVFARALFFVPSCGFGHDSRARRINRRPMQVYRHVSGHVQLSKREKYAHSTSTCFCFKSYSYLLVPFFKRHSHTQVLPVTKECCNSTGRAADTWPLYRQPIGAFFPLRHISAHQEVGSEVSWTDFSVCCVILEIIQSSHRIVSTINTEQLLFWGAGNIYYTLSSNPSSELAV